MGGAVVDASALDLRLNFDASPGGLAVSWPYGSVQVATNATGSYTTLSNVLPPLPVAPTAAPQSYYRSLR
jgi:hypothetical protein